MKMSRLSLAILALTIPIGILVYVQDTKDTRDFPALTELEERPLFTDLVKEMRERLREHNRSKKSLSEKCDKINWAPDIYAAIKRGTAEDKPIFLITFCSQNADPKCDV